MAGADTLRERAGTPIPPAETPDRDAAVARLQRRLNDASFEVATIDGRARELDRTIDLTVEVDGERPSSAARVTATPGSACTHRG